MILLGTPITASDAKSAGLVAQVVEPGTVLETAVQTASKLAGMSTSAISLAKEAICRGVWCPLWQERKAYS
jgi:enoyl-CoA hydratase